MTKKSLAELAAAFASKASGESQNTSGDQTWKLFYPFWKAAVDTVTTVRFVPDADPENPLDFLVEHHTHELVINGKREKVPCLKMYGEACPICELSQKYYDEESPDHNKTLGKKYYRKKSYIGAVIVIDSPIEHNQEQVVKLIDFGPKIFGQITSAFASGDLEEKPFELEGGYNFRIRKTKPGEFADYGTSSFAPKQSNVAPELLDKMELYDLKQYRTPYVERSVLEAMLLADQNGGSVVPQYGAKAAGEATPAADKVAAEPAVKPAATPAPAAEAAPAPAEGERKLSAVEKLRARQAAAQAAAE
ncbi:hypothetical protein [Janthinobacterium sp.]|uniref:hypothetical protein n=1 Tax=Janthinobacterium sp. TaxID=1871054 RepID=UPI00261C7371|nr:hypothetical protein [Janthinobacterium sp.]